MVVSEKSAETVVAVPVSPTTWGPPKALSLIVSMALRVPDSVGANVTVMTHEAPGPRPVPQVFVEVKLIPLPMVL